jgi:inorganic pyrophosphatase/exopolyphosphatase
VSGSCGTRSATQAVTVISHAVCNTAVSNTIAKAEELKVYPNPNHGQFVMEMLTKSNEQVNVTITNIIGKVVKEFTTTTNKTTEIKLNLVSGF